VDAEDDEVEIAPNFAFDFEGLKPCPPSVLHREIRPPTPRSEATVCEVTRCAYRKSNPAILMVQSAQDRAADDIPGPLNAAMDGGILVQ